MAKTDTSFSGAVAQFYDRYLGGMFRPHADQLVSRLSDLTRGTLLEVAAGTGNVTAVMIQHLPPTVAITATDLNQGMLDLLATKPGMDRVTVQQADALALPFADATFDAVVCQFGVMFYPDRQRGQAEAHRVLQPGGRYLFNVWDDITANPATETIDQSIAALYPNDPPQFLRRTPWGYHDRDRIRADLLQSGFHHVEIDVVNAVWQVADIRDVAIAFCQGTPLRPEIEARDPTGLAPATDAATQALTDRFGPGPLALPTQALLIETRA